TSSSRLFTGRPTRSPSSALRQGTMYSTLGNSRLPVICVDSRSRRSLALPFWPGLLGAAAVVAAGFAVVGFAAAAAAGALLSGGAAGCVAGAEVFTPGS